MEASDQVLVLQVDRFRQLSLEEVDQLVFPWRPAPLSGTVRLNLRQSNSKDCYSDKLKIQEVDHLAFPRQPSSWSGTVRLNLKKQQRLLQW